MQGGRSFVLFAMAFTVSWHLLCQLSDPQNHVGCVCVYDGVTIGYPRKY